MKDRTNNKFLDAPTEASGIRKNVKEGVLSQSSLHGIICLLFQTTNDDKFKQPYTVQTIKDFLSVLELIHNEPGSINKFRDFFAGLHIPDKFGDIEITIDEYWNFDLNHVFEKNLGVDSSTGKKDDNLKDTEDSIPTEVTSTINQGASEDYQSESKSEIDSVTNNIDTKSWDRVKLLFKKYTYLFIIPLAIVSAIILYNHVIKDGSEELTEQQLLQLNELQRIEPDNLSFTYDNDSIISLRRTTGTMNIVIFPKGEDLNFAKRLKRNLDSIKIKDSININTYINKYTIHKEDSLYRTMHNRNLDYIVIEKDNNKVQLLYPNVIYSTANPTFYNDDFQSGTVDEWLTSLSNITMPSNVQFLSLWIASNLCEDPFIGLMYINKIEEDFPERTTEPNYLLHKAHLLRNTLDSQYEKGQICENINDIYKQLLFINPQKNDYYIEYASFNRKKDKALAKQTILEALALQDSSLQGMQYLEKAFLESDFDENYLKDLTKAYDLTDNENLQFNILKKIAEYKNDVRSVEDYKELIKRDSIDGYRFYEKIANSYYYEGMYDEALKYSKRYIDELKILKPDEWLYKEILQDALRNSFLMKSQMHIDNSEFNKALQNLDSAKVYGYDADLLFFNKILIYRKQYRHDEFMKRLKLYKAVSSRQTKHFSRLYELMKEEVLY